jgi:PAS domain S-box-containing protein
MSDQANQGQSFALTEAVDQAARWRAVNDSGLLNAHPIDEFEPLCKLACQLTGAPVALVTVVGEHDQFIKCSIGTDVTHTSTADSFCDVAISRSRRDWPQPLVVEDATQDATLSTKSVVTGEPHIRFYAGVPYFDADGYPLGSVCVIDTSPRTISPEQVAQLEMLAKTAGQIVQLKQMKKRLEHESKVRHDAERQREETVGRLNILLDNLQDHVILLLDTDGKIQNWTVGLKHLFGYEPDDVIGKSIAMLFSRRDRDLDVPTNELTQARRMGKTSGIGQRVRKDGSSIWIEYKTSRILDAQGKVVGFSKISHDITQRIESERRFIEKRNRLQAITECSSSGIFELSPDGEITRANSVAREMLGLLQVEGQPYNAPHFNQERLDGSPLPVEEMPFSRLRASGQSLRDQAIALRMPDGTRRILLISGSPVRDASDHIAGYIFNAADITQQTEMVEKLRVSEERLQLTMAATEDGMWDWNIKAGTITTSDRWHTMLGYAPQSLVGLSQFDALVHPDDKEIFYRALDQHFSGQHSQYHAELRLRRIDGTWAHIRCRGKLTQRDADDRPLRMVGTHQDITQEHEAEVELQRAKESAIEMLCEIANSRERLQLALDGTGMGLWDHDLRNQQLFVSPQCLQMLGYDEVDFQNTPEAWMQLIHPEDRQLLHDATRVHIDAGTPFLEAEYRVRHKKGHHLHLHTRGRVMIRDEAGAAVRMSGTHQDVTLRVAAEQESLDNTLRLRRIAAELPGAVYEFTCETNGSYSLNYISEGARFLFGFGHVDPITFDSMMERINAADRLELQKAIDESALRLSPMSMQFRVNLMGKLHWLKTQSSPKRNSDGSVSFHGFTSDITDQQELLDTTARMNAMLLGQQDASIDGILVVDENRKVVSANKRFFEIWQLDDQTSTTPDDVYLKMAVETRVVDAPAFFQKVIHLYENPQAHSRDEIALKDGRTLDRYSAPLYTKQGDYVGRIWYFRDITQTKSVQLELSRARDEANAASAAKSEFLANTSHELRTPMTAILGFADLLSDDTATTEQRNDYLSTIKRNGEHLLSLINDVLDLSKIEAGKLQCESIDTDPAALLNDILELLNVRAKSKGICLELYQTSDLPVTIKTDPTRVRQILMNLIGNAIKFTEVGGVKVHMGFDPASKMFRVEVVDSGIGMSPEQCKRIFSPFVQADSSMTRKFGGTGLGLAISVRLARLLGGEIAVSSDPGKGSTFTLLLNLHEQTVQVRHRQTQVVPIEKPRALQVPQQLLLGKRVLLVEDGPDNQRLISHHLKKLGAEFAVCGNGQLGVEAVEAAISNGQPYNVILMDMQMPVMDGYEAAASLRSKQITTPIIALTAHAMAGDRQKCLDAGCTEYLTKPIQPRELALLLHRLSEQSHAMAA